MCLACLEGEHNLCVWETTASNSDYKSALGQEGIGSPGKCAMPDMGGDSWLFHLFSYK